MIRSVAGFMAGPPLKGSISPLHGGNERQKGFEPSALSLGS